jgi:hypothetical protein
MQKSHGPPRPDTSKALLYSFSQAPRMTTQPHQRSLARQWKLQRVKPCSVHSNFIWVRISIFIRRFVDFHGLSNSMELSPSWQAASCAVTPLRRVITVFVTALQCSLSWARSIQSIPSTHRCLDDPTGLFPSGFPTDFLHTFALPPFVLHALSISYTSTWSF